MQSYWDDEMVTVGLVHLPFGDMLTTIPNSENTPPLYYVLAWPWARVFGTSEVGLRSLSALFGVATVPVAYMALTELVSRRAGLVAAALTATNPFLIWYSQETRSYACVALLGALSLVFFLRALRSPTRRSLTGWAVSSALAIATHYFATFLVGAEALLLLFAHRRHAGLRWAAAVPVATGAALLPLAVHQRDVGYARWIAEIPLTERLRSIPSFFIFDSVASKGSALLLVKLLSVGLVAVGAVLFFAFARRREQVGGLVLLSVGALAVGASLVMAAGGVDVFQARNLIALWLPVAGVIAVGFAAQRVGSAGLGAAFILSLLGAIVAIAMASDVDLQRDDWSGVAAQLRPPHAARALVSVPGYGKQMLSHYGVAATPMPASGAQIGEVDLVYLPDSRKPPSRLKPLRGTPALAALRVTEIHRVQHFLLVRLEAAHAVSIRRAELRLLPTKLLGYTPPPVPAGAPSLPAVLGSAAQRNAPFVGVLQAR